jgi:hypothetical protein
MSVRTTADENLDEIRRDVKSLYLKLFAFYTGDDTWGRDEYSDEFEEKVEEALTHLRSAKKLLG